jgi:hypothetical protein
MMSTSTYRYDEHLGHVVEQWFKVRNARKREKMVREITSARLTAGAGWRLRADGLSAPLSCWLPAAPAPESKPLPIVYDPMPEADAAVLNTPAAWQVEDAVEVHAFGCWYVGEVVKVTRTKVHVLYTSGTGAVRVKVASLDLIRPVGSGRTASRS